MRPPRFVPKARRLFALASLAILLAVPSQAAVTVSGSTSTNPTADGADPIIGVDNIGRLTINGGSLVTSDVAIVGDLVNGVGLVSIQDFNAVTGLTSGWVVNSLIVGDEGTGRLEIINGAVLNLHFFISPGTGDFTVGNAADSLGTVIVNGLGSMLRLGDDSFIGVNGSALLRIENEGYVIATNDAVSGSDVFTVGLRGRVELDNGRLRTESLINNGAIVGHGRVDSELAITNSTSGRFEVFGSERMVVNAVVDNDGEIALVGGEIEFLEPVTNSNAAAKVTIRDGGIVRFPETGFGLDTTSGVLASTGGVNDIYGTVRIQGAGSKIVVAGQSTAVFHDPVTNNGGVLEVFPGSTPVFLQGLTIVAPVPAPTLSVHLADPNAEPGPGIVEVVGTAQLDGDLDITLAGGFSPLPGDRFTVLSSGGLSGTFESVNTTNPASGIQFYPIHTATDVEVFATAAGETTWGVDANGQASVGSNWFGGLAPGGVGDAAAFTTIISANRTVTLDAPLTLGSVAFDDDNNYTLQGATLTLQAAPAEDAIIDVRNAHGNGAHTIAAPVALVSDLELRQPSTGAFTLAGALDNSAGRSIIKSGVGSLILAGTQTHGVGAALQVTEGTVVMNTDAGSAASRNLAVTVDSSLTFGSTQHLAALNIGAGGNVQLTAGGQKNVVTTALTIAGGAAPTGRLDLTTNAAIVDYTNNNKK
jgi:T5SS/PEP-CTERM-associated repeat protein